MWRSGPDWQSALGLSGCSKLCWFWCVDGQLAPKNDFYADLLDAPSRKALQSTLTPPNEWVSVEDTVPDPGERVLATDGIFVGEAYRSSANRWFRHTGFPWRDGVTGRTVRFWMLLPAPPTKEE